MNTETWIILKEGYSNANLKKFPVPIYITMTNILNKLLQKVILKLTKQVTVSDEK